MCVIFLTARLLVSHAGHPVGERDEALTKLLEAVVILNLLFDLRGLLGRDAHGNNPSFGKGRKQHALDALIRAVADRSDVSVSLVYSEHPGHTRELARRAMEAGMDRIVAADGESHRSGKAIEVKVLPKSLQVVSNRVSSSK